MYPSINFEKTVKLAAAVSLASLLIWLSGAHAVSQVTRNRAPVIALKAVSDEPIALAALADKKFSAFAANYNTQQGAEIADLAMRSLRQQALNPNALKVLGFVKDANGESSNASQLIRMSAIQSRRNLGTQLWLIEESISNDKIDAALRQYHLALVTAPESKDILFPILKVAVLNPEVQKELLPYVNSNSNWMEQFFVSVLDDDTTADAIANIIIDSNGLDDDGGEYHRVVMKKLFTALLKNGSVEKIKQLLKTLPDAPANILTSSALTQENFEGLGWVFEAKPSLGSDLVPFNDSAKMLAFASPGQAGVVATKPLILRNGKYTLRSSHVSIQANTNFKAKWIVRCGGVGGAKTILDENIIINNPSQFYESFIVDSSCPIQFLNLYLAGGDGALPNEIAIEEVSVDLEDS